MFSKARLTATRIVGPASTTTTTTIPSLSCNGALRTLSSTSTGSNTTSSSSTATYSFVTTLATVTVATLGLYVATVPNEVYALEQTKDPNPYKIISEEELKNFKIRNSKELFDPTLPKTTTLTPTEIISLRKSIVDLIDEDSEKRGDGTSLAGTFIRLAWHCSGTFCAADKSGGSNGGLMRFDPERSWGANAGLDVARNALYSMKQQYPGISYADLFTYAGVVAVEEAGGPKIPFRFGRVDMDSGETSPPDGRLPDADKGSRIQTIQHIRDVFYRMGFNDQEIVALLGAHAMGRCHEDRSGYWGPWTNAETTFSNEYYKLLLNERWSPKVSHNGKVWTGPDQYENSDGTLMMLPSDIFLLADNEFKKYVTIYANDEERFFKDFAKAFGKLLELGVSFPSKCPMAIGNASSSSGKPWYQFW